MFSLLKLGSRNPALVALGLIRLTIRIALRQRSSSEVTLLQMAERSAGRARDVSLEISTRVEQARFIARELLSDGDASPSDQEQIQRVLADIEHLARNGELPCGSK